MYAVFRSGGKQYRASKGERIRLEKLEADEGSSISFDEVLLVGEGQDIQVGSPLVADGAVSAKVLRQGKSNKVSVVKFRRRQNYLRQHTHRQFFTEVEITDIKVGGKSTASSTDKTAKKTDDDSKKVAEKASAGKTAVKAPAKKASAKKASAKKASSKKASSSKAPAKKAAKKKPAASKKAAKKDD
jgi:large subunit ribosomal protein L21